MKKNLLAYSTQCPLPIAPGDWVSDGNSIARVRDVYSETGRTDKFLLDLILYARDGRKIGRESPAMGGPRHFEPAVEREGWNRVPAPVFPIEMVWTPNGRGGRTAVYDYGEAMPDRIWMPPVKAGVALSPPLFLEIPEPEMVEPDPVLAALMAIAEGHNDPRALAVETLTRLGFMKCPKAA